jgi:hypothetical protein
MISSATPVFAVDEQHYRCPGRVQEVVGGAGGAERMSGESVSTDFHALRRGIHPPAKSNGATARLSTE